MKMDSTVHEQVIEDLYNEALALADEARGVFDLRHVSGQSLKTDEARMALSIEGLRTTTRVMHVLAWLLNQRAYHSGELSRSQMLRYGTLGEERPSDPENMKLLELTTRSLIRDTERLYARVRRLDDEQRQLAGQGPAPVQQMHGRIAQAFGKA